MLEVLRALFGSARTQSSLVVQATGQFLEMLDNGCNLLEKVQPHLLVKEASKFTVFSYDFLGFAF